MSDHTNTQLSEERLEPPDRLWLGRDGLGDVGHQGQGRAWYSMSPHGGTVEYVRASVAAPREDASRIPQSALYWLKAAKDESHTMAERLFFMENAYNHVVNALYASPVSPSPMPEQADVMAQIRQLVERVFPNSTNSMAVKELLEGIEQVIADGSLYDEMERNAMIETIRELETERDELQGRVNAR